MIVRISAEITTPRPERESDGIFTISLELNDMAFPGFETGRYGILFHLAMPLDSNIRSRKGNLN